MSKQNLIGMMVALLLGAAACGSSDSNGGSGTSDELKAPTGLKAAPLDGGAHLTWSDNSNEAEFMIERKSEKSDWMTIATVPFDTTQYHDARIDPTMTYMYRVMPMSKDGKHGPASNEAICNAHMGAAGSGHAGR